VEEAERLTGDLGLQEGKEKHTDQSGRTQEQARQTERLDWVLIYLDILLLLGLCSSQVAAFKSSDKTLGGLRRTWKQIAQQERKNTRFNCEDAN
jgi:hypothetical protein